MTNTAGTYRKSLSGMVLFACLLFAGPPAGGAGASREDSVRSAMLETYFHGIDDNLANRIVRDSDTPVLRSLLLDPAFPRRDNVVAFLARSDRGRTTADLLSLLSSSPGSWQVPEEERALLLVPEALGRIAGRGDTAALEALLAMTGPGSKGGPLRAAAAIGPNSERLLADLAGMALRGLGFTRSPRARQRLLEIERGAIRLDFTDRDLSGAARRSLELFDRSGGGATGRAAGALSGLASTTLSGQGEGTGSAFTWPFPSGSLDSQSSIHESQLTFANHVLVSSPMSDARLDESLGEVNRRAGRYDFAGDVACCAIVSRLDTARSFGTPEDQLDIIDDQSELSAVLDSPISRVKVVRAINWCGTSASNILGCAWVGGNGMALVRMSDAVSEGILWFHEYGHNTGLQHSGDSRYFMYFSLVTTESGLTQAECDRFHSPSGGSGATPVIVGTCADADGDEVQDGIDNCPGVSNFGQEDFDGDLEGDDCDDNDDGDAMTDDDDCMPLETSVWSVPGEVLDIEVTEGPAGTAISWPAPSEPGGLPSALRYDTLQTTMASFDDPTNCLGPVMGPETVALTAATPVPAWTGEGNSFNAGFGASAAIAGDVDGDGFDDIAIGAPRYFNGEDLEGRVLVHPGSGSGPGGPAWIFEHHVAGANLGASVAGAGDVNGDGYDDVIVGAPGYEEGSVLGGRATLHLGSPEGVSSVPDWTAGEGQEGALFGAAVASAGDVNGDGYDDVIVGARLHQESGVTKGGAWIYLGSPSGLATASGWTAVGDQADARFGESVATAGDVNHDGFDDVIVGAPGYDSGQTDEGRVYLYLGSALGPVAVPAAVLEPDTAFARFGVSVAPAGDVNGDGYDDVAVGADMYDGGSGQMGRVFLYSGSPGGIAASPSWTLEGTQPAAGFGNPVARAGDVDGDGFADILVGAARYDDDLTDAGRAFLYLGAAAGPRASPSLVLQADQAYAWLGLALAGGGDVDADGLDDLLTGAQYHDDGELNEGKAYLFLGTASLEPDPGGIFYYLIRATNDCGTGPAGSSSAGIPRDIPSCP